jgi:magnesium transporter
MLTIYETRSRALLPQKGQPRISEQAIWIDLLDPTPEEEKRIEPHAWIPS